MPKPTRVEVKCSQNVILATLERVLVSQHRPEAEGLISILKCLKLTIDIIFQSHFFAHLTRSKARGQPGFRAGDNIAGHSRFDNAFHGRSNGRSALVFPWILHQTCCWRSETIGGRWYVNCYTLSSLYSVLKRLVWEKKWRRSNLKKVL
jgi:hypothetical protein